MSDAPLPSDLPKGYVMTWYYSGEREDRVFPDGFELLREEVSTRESDGGFPPMPEPPEDAPDWTLVPGMCTLVKR